MIVLTLCLMHVLSVGQSLWQPPQSCLTNEGAVLKSSLFGLSTQQEITGSFFGQADSH